MGRVGDLRGCFLWGADLAFWRLVAMGCDGLEWVSCGLCADWLEAVDEFRALRAAVD